MGCEDIIFGIGLMQQGATGVVFGELQNATVTHSAELELLYKRCISPYNDYIQYPIDTHLKSREIRIKAAYAKITKTSLQKILGGTLSNYGVGTNNRLTLYKASDLGEFSLYLKNPSDGSEIEIYFPRVISVGNLEIGLEQDDYVIAEPEFVALYNEYDGIICRITQP